MAAPVLQIKRGLLANLPGLRAGEPGFTTDSYDLYVGIDSTSNNNKFFGSHRYWTRGTATTGSGVNLVEGTNNGTQYLTLKAPDSLSGIATYQFPDSTDGSAGDYLKLTSYTAGIYALEWAPVPSGSFTISGDTGTDTFTTGETLTFAGTAAEIETAITNNQVQIGLPNNVVVSGILTATSFSGSFSGNATSATYATSAGVATYAASAGIATYAASAGIATYATSSGIATYATIAGIATYANTAGIATYANTAGIATYANTAGIATYATTAGIATYATTAGVSTNVIGGVASVTQLNVSGLSTFSGIATHTTALFGVQASFTGVVTALSFSGSLSGNATSATYASTAGIATYATTAGIATYATTAGVSTNVIGGVASVTQLNVSGISTLGVTGISQLSVSGIATIGTGVGITQFSAAVGTGVSASSVPTSKAVIDYVGTQIAGVDLTLGLTADSGGPSTVNTSQTLTLSGTTNEIETAVSGQTVTIGLPNNVTVTTALTTPTIKATNIQANDGTSAITINNTTGNVSVASSLTVTGDLTVLGSQTVVNTTQLQVEDNLIDLALVNSGGSLVVPTSDANIDIGVLFNYYTTAAKKAAVFWDDSTGRIGIASDITVTNNVVDTITAIWAPIEIGALWLNDCAGQSIVINCAAGTRTLENITVDGGSF